MSVDAMMEEIGKLDVDSRVELAWKNLVSLDVEKAPTQPTPDQQIDLGPRMAELDATRVSGSLGRKCFGECGPSCETPLPT